MTSVSGKSILDGIAIGRIKIFKKQAAEFERKSALGNEEELERFHRAQSAAISQAGELYEKALAEVGEENAAIFEVQQMMLEDDDYVEAIEERILSDGVTAEYAVASAGAHFAEIFASMEDAYMRARAADVGNISDQLVRILSGEGEETPDSDEPYILVAEDLTPGETLMLDKSRLLGFVTRGGSKNSHTAILARMMNLPALVGVDISDEWDGKMGILDGYGHLLYIEPEERIYDEKKARYDRDREERALLQGLRGQPSVTRSGRNVELCANIGNVADAALALENDAEGIGLFRSEFIFLESRTYPSEEKQFEAYKQVVGAMGGKKVVIRTLDIGADKQADYFLLGKEDNPALGLRAIRICLTREDIFKTQLRAILRASAFGTVAIMFPMVISVAEVVRAKEILDTCRRELASEGVPMGETEVGIMVETPAAVLIADDLAREVDFFSIGTNDLTQYMLAIDRQNTALDDFYDPHHPAVLKAIEMTVEAGHRAGCWVGICGELGADMTLTDTFLKMGVDELSVSPSAILPLRAAVRSL